LKSDEPTRSELLDALHKWMDWARQHESLIGNHRQFREVFRLTHDLLIKQELTQGTEKE
jgi:hypothetical protein